MKINCNTNFWANFTRFYFLVHSIRFLIRITKKFLMRRPYEFVRIAMVTLKIAWPILWVINFSRPFRHLIELLDMILNGSINIYLKLDVMWNEHAIAWISKTVKRSTFWPTTFQRFFSHMNAFKRRSNW